MLPTKGANGLALESEPAYDSGQCVGPGRSEGERLRAVREARALSS